MDCNCFPCKLWKQLEHVCHGTILFKSMRFTSVITLSHTTIIPLLCLFLLVQIRLNTTPQAQMYVLSLQIYFLMFKRQIIQFAQIIFNLSRQVLVHTSYFFCCEGRGTEAVASLWQQILSSKPSTPLPKYSKQINVITLRWCLFLPFNDVEFDSNSPFRVR